MKEILAGLGIVLVLAGLTFADEQEGAVDEELEKLLGPSAKGCLLEVGRFPIGGKFVPVHSPARTIDEQVFVSRYGRPRARHSSILPDEREAGAKNEHLELSYAGFTIQLSRPTVPPQGPYWVKRIRIVDRHLALPCDLHVGAPERVFIDVLGPPECVREAPEHRRWSWHEIKDYKAFSIAWHANIITHVGKNGTVEWIEWYYYDVD